MGTGLVIAGALIAIASVFAFIAAFAWTVWRLCVVMWRGAWEMAGVEEKPRRGFEVIPTAVHFGQP